jgi:hypothetical protein
MLSAEPEANEPLASNDEELFIIIPSDNVFKTNATDVLGLLTPPPNVVCVENVEADPVDTVKPLNVDPTAEAEIIKVAVLVVAITKLADVPVEPDKAKLISVAKFVAVPAAVEPVEKKYKLPSTSSDGIGLPEAINL